MPEYDFFRTVREDLSELGKELAMPGVREAVDTFADRFGVERDLALAALWRMSKRHGETLSTFVAELNDQAQREAAQADTEDGR